jgi:hypothetical protein
MLSDLDWALANIKPERKPDQTKWVYEAEAKGKTEYVRADPSSFTK